MRTRTLRIAAAVTLLMLSATQQSWAWGREGHRLTALVAEHYLTPETAAAVKELLGKGETLASVASWADDYRSMHPETGKWHYTDTDSQYAKYDRNRDCPENPDPTSKWRDCVNDRILYFELRLSDTTLSHQDRYEALKYLVHFIGDIHQPLHAIGDARGGNSINVAFLGSTVCGTYKCNLHGVWDVSLIDHRNLSEPKYLLKLIKDIEENNWERLAGGNPVQWVNTSHQYAVNAFAPNGALLDTPYVESQSRVVDSQLALGGLRLARVLNTILSHQSVPPATAAPVNPERRQLKAGEAALPPAPAADAAAVPGAAVDAATVPPSVADPTVTAAPAGAKPPVKPPSPATALPAHD